VLAADNAPQTEGLGCSRGGDWGVWTAPVRGKGEGIGEGMTIARLFPSTDDADTRTHEGQTDESDCRKKKMSIF